MAKKTTETKTESKTLPELRKELIKLKLDVVTGAEKNTAKLKLLRKEIARLLTKANGK
jgi:ribosomal protein L29